jgi:RHS repeat-associated protein
MGTVSYLTIGGEIISETRSGVESDYVPDSLGSTIALLNSSQTITDTWTYWPYGELQSRSGTNSTPMQWVGTLGYHHDSSLAQYVRSRRLRKDLARWLSADPLWPSEEAYVYVTSSPILLSDPTDLKCSPPGDGNGKPHLPHPRHIKYWGPIGPHIPCDEFLLGQCFIQCAIALSTMASCLMATTVATGIPYAICYCRRSTLPRPPWRIPRIFPN